MILQMAFILQNYDWNMTFTENFIPLDQDILTLQTKCAKILSQRHIYSLSEQVDVLVYKIHVVVNFNKFFPNLIIEHTQLGNFRSVLLCVTVAVDHLELKTSQSAINAQNLSVSLERFFFQVTYHGCLSPCYSVHY